MKKIIKGLFVIFSLILVQAALAQAPANDACANAQNLGALPDPGAGTCPGGGVRSGTAVTLVGSSTNATGEAPYTTIVNCETGTADMASPALDVWYTFTTTGTANSIQISVTNFAGGAHLGVWSGTCGSLTPRGCSVDGTLTVEPVAAGQQFFLQVSGSNATATDGNFNISVQNNFNCNDCFTAGTITATPPPVNGTYQPGQTVNFCFHVDDYNEVSVNWLHGVQLGLGSGWNAGSVVATPAQSWGGDGTWNYYPAGITSNNNGATWPPGWYFNRTSTPIGGTGTAGDSNPGNNYGDEAETGSVPANRWNFCFDVTANAACSPGSDLSVTFNTSGDGESGFYGSLACTTDPPMSIEASGACCPPVMSSVALTCNGANNGTATATPTPIGGTYTYTWTGPSGYTNTQTGVVGASTITGLAAGTYSVSVTNASNCVATGTVTVTQPTAIVATITPTNPTCTGTGSIAVTAISGATSPYDISIDNGSNYTINNVTANQTITGLSAGSYTVVIRDANNCIRTFPVTTLTATGSVVASFAVPAAQCLTGNSYSFTPSTTGSTAGSIVAGTTTYDFNFGNGNNPAATTSTAAQTVTYAAAGTYTVSLTVTSGSCTNTFTAAVVVNPMPALPTATLVQPTCGLNNGSITITGPGTTYSLNNAAGPFSATTSYTNLAPGTYTVYVRNGTTCTSNQTFTLTNVPGPTAIATTTTTAHCGQSDGSITLGAVTGGTSAYTYSVTPTVGFSGTITYTGQASGTHTITVRDANSCTYTTTVNVPNASGPTAQALTSTPANCGTATGQVVFGATTGGSPAYTYSFNGSAYTTTTTYSSLLPGTYNAGVTDNFGCTYTTTVNVASNPGPTALALTPAPANCGATNGSITIGAVTGGTGGFTYSFNNVAGPFTATSPITGLGAGTYSVTVRDVNGCVFTNTVTVTASSGPTDVVLTSTPATCGASNGTITVGAVTGGAGVITYSLDGSPFNSTTSFTGQTATTHTVIVRDGNGCEYTETIGVSSSTGPTALAVTSTPSACAPSDGTVTIGAVTGGTGPGFTYSFNGSALTATTNYTGVAPGTYPVSVRDQNGCVFATTITVDPSLPPTAIVTTPVNSTCGNANGTVTYGAVTGGTPGYTYSFNNSAYGAATSYTIAAGTYNVGVRDSKGCTYTTTVTVLNTPGPTDLVLTPTSSTCGNNNGQVVVTTTTGGTSNYTYTIDGGASQASTTFTGLSAITHTVVVTDANGCTYTETIAVSNLPGPTAQAVTTTNSTCGNSNGALTIGATTGGTGAITWQVDGTGGFTATTNYTGLAAGTHTVEVRDVNLCPLTVTVTVANTPGPTAVALSQVSSNCGTASGSITVGTVTGGTSGYTYSIDGGTNYQAGTTFSSLLAGTYTITVKDANNCLTTNTITVNNVGAPTVTLTAQTPVTCFGLSTGSASFSATGGAGGFTYTLNTGVSNLTGNFTNLAQGTYTVTVVDAASCPATQTVNIFQPTALSGSIVSQTNPLCNGGTNGSLEVTGLNATPGYTYSLNGGASQASGSFGSLAAGTYTVTVTDSRGCTFPVPVTLGQPTPVTVVMSSTNANCTAANGTATAAPSGGTSGYTYVWTPSGGTGATTVGVIAGSYSVTVTDAQGCTATGNTTIGVTPGGTATISSVTQVNCNGGSDGSITVSMSATAATSYTYTWLPSGGSSATASGLSAGTYTVNIVDNFGCTATANAAVTQPLPLAVTLTSTNVSCNGGSDGTITSSVTGGTTPYSYVWSHGASAANASGLPIGTYTLNVTDAHSCVANANVTLSQPTVITITPVVTNANCNQSDGSFTVTAAGGAGGYSYSLNGGLFINPGSFTGLASGTYTVTVKDGNNCESSFPVTVGDNAGPTASITASTNVSCFGGNDGTATITASGGTNTFVYLWSNGSVTPTATGLAAGIYTVTATDGNGCVASTGVTITQPTQLVASASGIDPLCNGGNTGSGLAGALGGTPPYTYSWTTIPVQTTANATGLIAGPYNVIVTDSKACQSTASITLTNPPALTASITPVDLNCFNQCTGTATAVIGNATLPIQYTWTGGQTTAIASGLCAGSYTVNIVDGNNCTATANTTINQPTQLVATIPTSGNETCFNTNDAFAQGSASGGTPGYTFTWSNAFVGANNTNLDAGTYTLTVTDSKGCTDVEQVTLTAPPVMDVTVTKTDITCNYAPPYPPINDGTAFATTTGGTAPYQYLWQPMLYTVNNPVTLQAGSHTVVVTDDNGCTDSATIFINEPPEFTIALESDSSNCHFSNGATNVVVTGGATPHTIAWSNGVTTPYNPGLPAGQYDIIVTDAVGCLVNGTAVVEDIEGPNVTITDSTNITCFGANNGTAVAVANGGVLPYMSLGWAGTTQSGLSATNLGPGPATILVYDAAGCLGSDQTFIMEPTDVVGAVVSYQDVTCYNLFNGSAVIQATGGLYPTDTNADNAYTISITSPTQTQAGVAPNTSISFSGLGVGAVGSTHVYNVTVTDVRGCQDATTFTISQPQALVISNPIETDITCFGLNNGQISVTATGGTPVYSYNWTSSNVGFVNPGTPAISGLSAGSYTLSLVDVNGCTDNQTASVIEPTQIVLDSSVVSASCGLANGSATVLPSGGTPIPGGNYTYQWNTSPNQTTQTATGLSQNVYNVQVRDLNGCIANTDVVVPNAAGPSVANISSYAAACFGSSTGAADVDAIGGTAPLVYTWTNSNGTTIVSGPTPNDSVVGIPAGTYNVNVVDANGCFFNAVSVVAQPSQLNLIVSTDQTMCYGDSVQIYANVGGGTPPYTWNWLHNGVSVPAYNITSGSLATGPYWVSPSYLTPLHTYSVSVIDANNCPVAGQSIDVTTLPPITIASTDLSACNFDIVNLSANASGGNTSIGGNISLTWTPGNLTGSTVSVLTQDNPIHEMVYTVTASDGCSRDTSLNIVVTINPKPTASLVGSNISGCEDLDVSFSGAGGNGFVNLTYEWNFGDNTTGFGANTTHTYSASGLVTEVFDVQLIVISDKGCRDTMRVDDYVSVFPTPDAQFTFDPLTTTEFDPEINFYNQSLLGNTFAWNFGDPSSIDNSSVLENPIHTYAAPGLYNVGLTVTSVNGCIDTVSRTVYIEPEFAIYVPTAFSPNVDSRNEFFYPQGIGIDEDRYNMYIYDRWGELIFETNNFSKGWDGTAKGKTTTVQEDVYIWKIIAYDLKNNKHNLTGHVTVVR